MKRKNSRKPTHPGICFLEDVLKPSGKTIADFTRTYGYSYPAAHAIMTGKTALSERAAEAFADFSGTTKQSWLVMQNKFDLWEIENS